MKGALMFKNFSLDDFLFSLEVMGKGMLSIFVVIILLYIIVVLIGKITDFITKRRQQKQIQKS